MTSLEAPEIQKVDTVHENANSSLIDTKTRALLDGPPSSVYNFRQIQLAVEKFSHEHPNDTLNQELINDVLMTWASSNYSKDWRAMVSSEEFKRHPRFKGDCANVTLEDLERYVRTRIIPE